MLERSKLGLTAVAALLVGGISTAWTLRGELSTYATQSQLAAAVAAMDGKLSPIADKIERLADRVTDVDKRLSRLEGRMESSSPPSSRPP